MKSLIIILLMAVSSFSFGQTKKSDKNSSGFSRQYGLAGCGLGSVLMGKKGAQIFAATTNATAFNQMFGISAGTLNCVDSPSAEVAGRIDHFILVNRSQIQGDIARGSGETISALVSYMGCASSSSQVGAELKANYSNIFNGEAKANEITDSIISVVLDNKDLSVRCNNLG